MSDSETAPSHRNEPEIAKAGKDPPATVATAPTDTFDHAGAVADASGELEATDNFDVAAAAKDPGGEDLGATLEHDSRRSQTAGQSPPELHYGYWAPRDQRLLTLGAATLALALAGGAWWGSGRPWLGALSMVTIMAAFRNLWLPISITVSEVALVFRCWRCERSVAWPHLSSIRETPAGFLLTFHDPSGLPPATVFLWCGPHKDAVRRLWEQH